MLFKHNFNIFINMFGEALCFSDCIVLKIFKSRLFKSGLFSSYALNLVFQSSEDLRATISASLSEKIRFCIILLYVNCSFCWRKIEFDCECNIFYDQRTAKRDSTFFVLIAPLTLFLEFL